MYRHHFGLSDKPFQIAPSPKFLFPSETHDESRARVLYGICDNRGFTVVYGQVGLGKTTVLLSVLDELEVRYRTALVFHPVANFHQLLRLMAHEFGVASEGRDEVELLHGLTEFFIARMAAGESCVLIIDEAQNLSLELMENVRMLSNLQTEESSLLQIVLVGQPELFDKLMDPRLLQLRQRVGVWHEITPLDEEETQDYIYHRLARAGARRPKEILAPAICARVHELSSGAPRIINQICDTALLIAYGRNEDALAAQHVEEAARELHLLDAPVVSVASRASARAQRGRRANRVSSRLLLRSAAAIAMLLLGTWLVRAYGIPWWQSLADGDLLGSMVSWGTAEESTAAPDSQPGGEGLAAEEIVAESASPSDPAAALDAAPVDVEAAVQAAARRAQLAQLGSRLDEVNEWRGRGELVYGVHLHSFRDASRAEAFAAELSDAPGWDQPLFVERTDASPSWYRVLAGGFRDSGTARSWIRSIKGTRGLSYAQVMPLAAGAEAMLPRTDVLAEATTGANR